MLRNIPLLLRQCVHATILLSSLIGRSGSDCARTFEAVVLLRLGFVALSSSTTSLVTKLSNMPRQSRSSGRPAARPAAAPQQQTRGAHTQCVPSPHSRSLPLATPLSLTTLASARCTTELLLQHVPKLLPQEFPQLNMLPLLKHRECSLKVRPPLSLTRRAES